MLAVMGTSVRHVSSSMFAILVLLSFIAVKDWVKIYKSLSTLEKTFALAFVFYTISGILSFYNVDDVDEYIKLFERYLRFSLIIPVYLLIIKNRISVLNYLYYGAVISGPFLVIVALRHFIEYPEAPAQGHYHHIIFGQLAMLNVGIMLSLLLTKSLNRQLQVLILISMLCGIAAAAMSQARGVWLVFPVYILFAAYYALKGKRTGANHFVVFLLVIILLSIITPIGDLIKGRVDIAVTEVSQFYNEGKYLSSVGTRLAMWDIAIDVWEKNPILGTGPSDFDNEIVALQNKGEYVGMELHNSVHNIYFQALVGSGIIGLFALLMVVFIMPLKLFFDKSTCSKEACLSGFITVLSFIIYGFSESWTLRLPQVSVFLVYIIVIASHIHIACLQKKPDGI